MTDGVNPLAKMVGRVRLVLVCTIFPYVIYAYNSHCSCVTHILLTFGILLTVSLLKDWLHKIRISAKSLAGRAVLITGCDTGFGNYIAKRLHTLGFLVFAGCLETDSKGAAELSQTGKTTERLVVLKMDVTSDTDVSEAVSLVRSRLQNQGLWALINNAGVAVVTPVEWCPMKEFERLLAVNAVGTARVCRAFLPLVRQNRGRVINITSLAARIGLPGYGAYTTSKFAAMGFTECLRREMIPFGVKVVAVMPNLYRTPLTDLDKNVKDHHRFWSSLPADVRSHYGEKYSEAWLQKVRIDIEENARTEIDEVIDVVTGAVTCKFPKAHYTTPRVEEWLILNVLDNLPICLQDFIVGLLWNPVFKHVKKTKPK